MKVEEGKTIIDVGECDGDDLIELSVSRSKKWKACQVAHDYRYVQRLRPKAKVRPLTLGSLVHKCLEAKAKGEDWVQEIRKFRDGEWSKLFEEEKVELGNIPRDTLRIMKGYHFFYMESDKRYETIATEVAFRVRIEGTPVVIVGLIDLIVRDTTDGAIWCIEHKTAKRDIPTEEFRMTDVQTTVYLHVMELIADQLNYDPQKVKGVILDYLKTKEPTIPEILKNGTLSKRKITCDYHTYLDCIKSIGGDPEDYKEILEYMKENVFYRRVAITKSTAMTELTLADFVTVGQQIKDISGKCPSRNLSWGCDRPKCEYRDLCIAEIQGFDTEMLIKMSFERKEVEKNAKDNDEAPVI